MMIRNVSILFGMIGLMLSNVSYAQDNKNPYDPYRVLYYLDGYKCMVATTNINDRGNAPAPKLYEASDKNAKIIGQAGLTVLVSKRIPQINNRQAILTSNGNIGWVDVKYLYPRLEPCKGVLFANGIHGFDINPAKIQK